jgi:hypothetical protein
VSAPLTSICGAPLAGDRLVRLTYLDEAGISANEGFLVVGGVLIDGDRQLTAIENHFNILLLKHIPIADRAGFVFHATDIWSGGGYFKDREQWPLDKRLAILDDLVAIPEKFALPVSFGAVDWPKFTLDLLVPGCDQRDLEIAAHAVAFGHCCMGVEKFMRMAFPTEVTILIAEDRDSVRASLKEAISVFRNPVLAEKLELDQGYFPFEKIKDTVHFAKKSESRHLQIADICTFVLRGHLLKKKHNDRFYNVLKPLLIWTPHFRVAVSAEQSL